MRSIGADVACAAGYPGVHDDHNRSPDRDPTVTKGLLVRLEARPGREDDVERFLVEGRSLVEQEVTKGILLTFAPKSGHEDDVAEFLREAREFVQEEPGTLA